MGRDGFWYAVPSLHLVVFTATRKGCVQVQVSLLLLSFWHYEGVYSCHYIPASGIMKVYGLVPWVFFLVVNHADHSKYPMAHYCGWQRFHPSLPHLLQHVSQLCAQSSFEYLSQTGLIPGLNTCALPAA